MRETLRTAVFSFVRPSKPVMEACVLLTSNELRSRRRRIAIAYVGDPTPGAVALTLPDVQIFSVLNDELAVAVADTGNVTSPGESKLAAFCEHSFFRCPVDGEL